MVKKTTAMGGLQGIEEVDLQGEYARGGHESTAQIWCRVNGDFVGIETDTLHSCPVRSVSRVPLDKSGPQSRCVLQRAAVRLDKMETRGRGRPRHTGLPIFLQHFP
jgi:hypothetical protein